MNFFTEHLAEAKRASGSDEPLSFSDYFVHCFIAAREGFYLVYMTFAAFVHAFCPWWYGFEMIDWQIDGLKRLKSALPNLPVWKRITFND